MLCITCIFCIFEGINHFDSFFEKGSIRCIYFFSHHDHLDNVGIPIIENKLLLVVSKRMKNDGDIMAIFFAEGTTIEKCLKSGVYGWHETQKSTCRQKKKTNTFIVLVFLDLQVRIAMQP